MKTVETIEEEVMVRYADGSRRPMMMPAVNPRAHLVADTGSKPVSKRMIEQIRQTPEITVPQFRLSEDRPYTIKDPTPFIVYVVDNESILKRVVVGRVGNAFLLIPPPDEVGSTWVEQQEYSDVEFNLDSALSKLRHRLEKL